MFTTKKQEKSRPLVVFFVTLLCLFFIVSTINFVADPGEIYLKNYLNKLRVEAFVKKLFNAKYGIVQSGWNERLVKVALARHADEVDCVIIGSSHVMQFSTTRHMSINTQCATILNLGVSGGSLEDIAIFAYIITNSMQKPSKVFIGIDPWTLKYNMDPRWGENKDIYEKMKSLLKEKANGGGKSYLYSEIINLINFNYLRASINLIRKGDFSINSMAENMAEPIEVASFDFEYGYKDAVTLQDGSNVYDKDYIQKASANIASVQDENYKIEGDIYDIDAVSFFTRIVTIMRESGISVNFLLTPYHENVFVGESETVKHIRGMDRLIRDLSKQLDIHLYGSYFPADLGCVTTEFYDFMHAKGSCLNKIKF